jgi:hypothetical protein
MKNPQKVVEAFTTGSNTVAGIEFREFTSGTFLILQKIDSPLLKGGTKMDDQALLDLLFVLSRPSSETLSLLQQGRNAFDLAVLTFADGINPNDLPAIGKKLQEVFSRSVSTLPGHSAQKKTAKG